VDMVQVTDGEEAFNQLQGPEPFQLLLSDVVMPRCSGIELLARIRADERLKDLQVMLLSARGGEDAGLDALQSGANHYLAKPFSSKELLIRTHQQLQLAAVRVTLEQRVKERTQELEQERESFKRLGELLGVGGASFALICHAL
jgi:CheY-like chemotaxis protein